MDLLQVAGLGAVFSLAVSGLAAVLLLGPTRAILESVCPTGQGVTFWTRFTVLMIILGPLIVTLTFGVPPSAVAGRLKESDLIVRTLSAALFGGFLTVAGIGLRIATLRRQEPSSPPRRKSDDELAR